ncbi:MAG: arylsulfatase [Opitutales bacterium]|nr:arylsulfatase [Opitutales bacterium]
MTFKSSRFIILLIWVSVSTCVVADIRPNIIYILADDLGYGDLSCYGQEKFKTPNIDRLAERGMKLTQHYSGSTVCAPSRSSLLTGLHTGHTPIRGNLEVKPEGQHPIPKEVLTLPKLLRANGYTTGMFGKWGLGYPGSEGDPNEHFNQFFGFNCQRLGHHYYPRHLWNNREKAHILDNAGKQKKVYAPSIIHDQVLRFIEDNASKPFFCFIPTIIPHAELIAPEKYMERFRGKIPEGEPYVGLDDGPEYRQGKYESQKEPRVAFAAMISLLDDQVGEIVEKLESLGISEQTLIIFASDNGPHQVAGGDPDFFNSNAGFRGYKRDLYEGGIRIPMIAYWPGQIAPSSESNHISAFWDVLPTLAELIGAEIPDSLDGISFLPTLFGQAEDQQEHEYLYWEFHEKGGRLAIRKGNWKAVQYNVLSSSEPYIELYNLEKDLFEKHDLSDQHPNLIKEFRELFKTSRTPSSIFKFQHQGYRG